MSFTVNIEPSGHRFSVEADETVLDAALRQNIGLPYGCRNGACGACVGTLKTGDVDYPSGKTDALEQAGEGACLLCQAVPRSDLSCRVNEVEQAQEIAPRLLPCRVDGKEQLAHDVMRLLIKLPEAERLQFLAGQYLEILVPEGKRRAFSIASPPQSEDLIELHVRHVDGGGFTSWVFDELKVRDILRLEAPLGTFFVRNDATERPLLMVGGGTGFAPLKSMIEDLLSHGDKRPLHLFWGAATQAELYMHGQVQQWDSEHAHIRYTSALSEVDAGEESRTFPGLVHEAVLAAYPDLSAYDIYISGPPAMVETGRTAFLEHGAEKRRIFFDSFEFGLDVPVRVLKKPH